MILDYRNGENVEQEVIYQCYNDLGSAVVAGEMFFLSYEGDADSLSPTARPTLMVPATSAIYRKVVVALEAVADQAWGKFMYAGHCPLVLCASTVAINDYLQGVTATRVAGDDSTTQTIDSFGIAVTDYSATTTGCEAILFGEKVNIG